MQVILLERITNLGKLGDTVMVKPGFARNYLIPYGKALSTTKENLVAFEKRRKEYEDKEKEIFADAGTKAKYLEGLSLNIVALASEEGKLFGSVSSSEVQKAILEKVKIDLSKNDIHFPNGPIKEVGEAEVFVYLHEDLKVKILVNVENKKETRKEASLKKAYIEKEEISQEAEVSKDAVGEQEEE